MILEAIVTTLSLDGRVNIAPMGPRVEPDGSLHRFVLRPYRTSTTYANLRELGEGVLHVTDDVEMLARAAIGRLDASEVPMRPADLVQGQILTGSCRYCEFRVVAIDDAQERITMTAEGVAEGRLRDFFGFNRAKHAVVEAAILATRTALLPVAEILDEYQRLRILIDKTGGPSEHAAFEMLHDHVRSAAD